MADDPFWQDPLGGVRTPLGKTRRLNELPFSLPVQQPCSLTLANWSEIMVLHVTEARYERDYVVDLKFNDGAEGFVDLAEELYGEMFEPLKDVDLFKSVRLDPKLGTIA